MNVSLGSVFDGFVNDLVKSGHYQSNSEVVREALRLLQEQQQVRQLRLRGLRNQIQVALDEEARGEVAPWDSGQIKKEGRRRLAARKRAR